MWWRLLAGCQISGMAIEKWKASSGGNCSSAGALRRSATPLPHRQPTPFGRIQDSSQLCRRFWNSCDRRRRPSRSSSIVDVIACSKRVSRIYFYNFASFFIIAFTPLLLLCSAAMLHTKSVAVSDAVLPSSMPSSCPGSLRAFVFAGSASIYGILIKLLTFY